jgi:hypothetical protein
MAEKNILEKEPECLRNNPLVAERGFLIGESLAMTDIWRSRMEGGHSVEKF